MQKVNENFFLFLIPIECLRISDISVATNGENWVFCFFQARFTRQWEELKIVLKEAVAGLGAIEKWDITNEHATDWPSNEAEKP